MFQAERTALRLLFRLPRSTLRETLSVAALYAVQATVCLVLIEWGYGRTPFKGVTWAVIAAILALQPGFRQSVVTSVIRIAANTVGAAVALLVSKTLGTTEAYLILSIVIVVFTCELLRLDAALRTACVAVIIVLRAGDGSVVSTGAERFTATIIGCLTALAVQLLTDAIRHRFVRRPTPAITAETS